MRKTTRLRQLIEAPQLLVMPGAFDPLSARLIAEAGFHAVQGSGLAISANHLGMPDVSIISMREMAERSRVIASSVDIPFMADGDTGFGNAVNVWYTVRAFEEAGAAGINLEDQVMPKRCGHLAGKEVIPVGEMCAKLAAAVDARQDPDFVINARTDALAVEGLDATITRARAYFEAGATMVFVDGADSRPAISRLAEEIGGPLARQHGRGRQDPARSHLLRTAADGCGPRQPATQPAARCDQGDAQRTRPQIIANDGTSADPEIFADFEPDPRARRHESGLQPGGPFPRAGTPRAQIPPAKRMKESSAMQSPAKREGYPLGLAAAGGRNRRLRELLRGDALVMAPGCFDCITARLVAGGGFPVAYITGSGVSMSALGAPDLGAISFAEVAERARRIADSVDIPRDLRRRYRLWRSDQRHPHGARTGTRGAFPRFRSRTRPGRRNAATNWADGWSRSAR